MPSQTASTSTAGGKLRTAAALRTSPSPAARRARAARPPASPAVHDGTLPSYCGRRPAAMLDDGWIDDAAQAPDDLEALESGEDVLIDFGDLEDSR